MEDVISISHNAYPQKWPCSDPREYYSRMLGKPDTVLVLLSESGMNVGFLFAIPQNQAVEELKAEDSEMEKDLFGYYIENIAILPSYRKKDGLPKMFLLLKKEMDRKGILRISLHARVSNGLSRSIRKNLKVIHARRIENWKYYDRQEATDYIIIEWQH